MNGADPPPPPPVAEAHIAIGVMPTFFTENPRQWFQTVGAQFATARRHPAAAAMCRRSRRSTTALARSSSAACTPSSSRWAARRTRSLLPASSPAAPARRQRPRRRPWLHPTANPPPPRTRERRRVRLDLNPQPAAADSGTVFPAQPGRFFERPEEATKSRYAHRQRGPPPGLKDYSFFLSHRDQEAGGTYVESPNQGPPPSQHTVYEPAYTRGRVCWPSIQLTPIQLTVHVPPIYSACME